MSQYPPFLIISQLPDLVLSAYVNQPLAIKYIKYLLCVLVKKSKVQSSGWSISQANSQVMKIFGSTRGTE